MVCKYGTSSCNSRTKRSGDCPNGSGKCANTTDCGDSVCAQSGKRKRGFARIATSAQGEEHNRGRRDPKSRSCAGWIHVESLRSEVDEDTFRRTHANLPRWKQNFAARSEVRRPRFRADDSGRDKRVCSQRPHAVKGAGGRMRGSRTELQPRHTRCRACPSSSL